VVLGTGGIFTPATVPGASPRTAPSLDRTRDGAGGPSPEKTAPATCGRAGDWQLAKGRRRSEKQRGSGRRAPARPSDETGRQVEGRRGREIKEQTRRRGLGWAAAAQSFEDTKRTAACPRAVCGRIPGRTRRLV